MPGNFLVIPLCRPLIERRFSKNRISSRFLGGTCLDRRQLGYRFLECRFPKAQRRSVTCAEAKRQQCENPPKQEKGRPVRHRCFSVYRLHMICAGKVFSQPGTAAVIQGNCKRPRIFQRLHATHTGIRHPQEKVRLSAHDTTKTEPFSPK
jgi:hypothetical protein